MKKKTQFILKSYTAVLFFIFCAYIFASQQNSFIKSYLQHYLSAESDLFPSLQRFAMQFAPKKDLPASAFHRLTMPVDGEVVLKFGERADGVLLKCRPGEKVLAGEDGKVEEIRCSKNLGYYIDINHGNVIFTRYVNVTALSVKQGQRVRRGDTLGRVARAHGGNFFFQLFIQGKAVNPLTASLREKGI